MTRIASLNVLLSTSGKDSLAETYGEVIANVRKAGISNLMKNTALSGTPNAGSVEAKRFVNRKSKAYGTARGAGKGEAVKVTPVTIAINQDKELVTEVEQKDVSLYGVDNFIDRQAQMDEQSMIAELETAFWAEASTAATTVSTTGTTAEEIAEEMIQHIESLKNDYVDGVDRSMINLVCTPKFYGKLRTYMDKVVDGGAKAADFGMFHGVKCYSSTYLAEDDEIVCIADGAIAQPVLPTVMTPEKVQLSNAYAFGLFFSYGTKAVAADMIAKKTTA